MLNVRLVFICIVVIIFSMVEIEWCVRGWDLWFEKILRKMLVIWIVVDFK